jgi:hypothetical protein
MFKITCLYQKVGLMSTGWCNSETRKERRKGQIIVAALYKHTFTALISRFRKRNLESYWV